jgi:hypothetical protein
MPLNLAAYDFIPAALISARNASATTPRPRTLAVQMSTNQPRRRKRVLYGSPLRPGPSLGHVIGPSRVHQNEGDDEENPENNAFAV